MRRFHIDLRVIDVRVSVRDYSERLGAEPSILVPWRFALWRTTHLNFSVREVKSTDRAGLAHLGWEDEAIQGYSRHVDVNGIVWSFFGPEAQTAYLRRLWPQAFAESARDETIPD